MEENIIRVGQEMLQSQALGSDNKLNSVGIRDRG